MFRALVFIAVLALVGAATTINARAADAGRGRHLAQDHCAACHVVTAHGRNDVAVSPPFAVIGRKYGFNADVIAHVIAGPHPKMNFAPNRADAADIAAYIATLR